MIRTTEFKKTPIHYTDQGKGRVIVLIHGFLGSHKVWSDYVIYLSEKFRVITIDLPGHGSTDSIGYYHSMELLAQSVKVVLTKIGVRRYVMVGHSMGGYVTLAFAELFPENIKGIGLFHSTAEADSIVKKDDRSRLIELVKKGRKQLVTDTISTHFSAASSNKKLKRKTDAIQNIATDTSEQSIINSLEGMKERKSRDLILKFAEYPVLFVLGKQDTIIPYESIFSQIGLCKHPSVIVMEEHGHLGFYEEPKQVFTEFESFIKRSFKNKID